MGVNIKFIEITIRIRNYVTLALQSLPLDDGWGSTIALPAPRQLALLSLPLSVSLVAL